MRDAWEKIAVTKDCEDRPLGGAATCPRFEKKEKHRVSSTTADGVNQLTHVDENRRTFPVNGKSKTIERKA